jgi:hypothetical protein
MGGTSTLIKDIKLASKEGGVISVSHVTKPYGEESESVISIGVSLQGETGKPDWKAHVPYENIDEVIAALQEAKEKYYHG